MKIGRSLLSLISGMLIVKWAAKLASYLLAVLIFAASVAVIVYPDAASLLKAFKTLQAKGVHDPLPKARELYQAKEYCQALEYLEHCMDYPDVVESPEVQDLYARIKADRESWSTVARNVFDGVWKGKGPCLESLVSATVTDFFVVGDLRDLAWEGNKIRQGQEIDEFTVVLSGVGLTLSAVTYATAPVKGSISVLKLAKKTGKLPHSLQTALVAVFKEAERTKSWKPFEPVAEGIYRLRQTKDFKVGDSLILLSRCKDVKDIGLMADVVAVCGKKTGKFLNLGGDASVVVFKKFGKHGGLPVAMDSAIRHGPEGLRLLEKTGPNKFMKYLVLSKFMTRGIRSWHEERLSELLKILALYVFYWLMSLLSWLPTIVRYALLILSGLVVIGVPSKYLYRASKVVKGTAL
jgi:hypothetical protein